MIKRLYIDNFKCFVNFEMNFESINLLMGSNGAGKSSVFEVLHKIQTLIRGGNGKEVYEIFTIDSITRWQKHPIQSFELEIEGNGGIYKYELVLEHEIQNNLMKICYERLWFDNQPVIIFESGKIQLYQNDHSAGQSIPFDSSQSVISLFSGSALNNLLIWFKKYIEQKIIVVKIDPMRINLSTSKAEKSNLSKHAENFFSWYHHISQDQGKAFEIISYLREILDGFNSFKFIEMLTHRSFKVIFSDDNKKSTEYWFHELSDGQRVLIILHTLLYATKGEGYTLCIDEPENFLALPEIQPWLTTLYDYCNAGEMQALLISHHPQLIDYLAVSSGYWLDRQKNGPVRVKRITEDESGLSVSELVARGWLYE